MNITEAMQFGAKELNAARVENARFEADCLLGFGLGIARDRLYLDRERQLNSGDEERYRVLIKRRAAREPLQYILGHQEFMGLDFYVDPRVLIPRPDSEILVEKFLELVRASCLGSTRRKSHFRVSPRGVSLHRRLTFRTSIKVLDLCTGSGALAIAVAHFLPTAYVVGTDISAGALAVAGRNAANLKVGVEWRQGDFLGPAEGEYWDWIICNPPYVSRSDYEKCAPEVHHEPVQALVGGMDGLDYYRRLAAGVRPLLTGRGGVLTEIGWDQADRVQELFQQQGFTTTLFVDTGGRDRVVWAR